MGKGYKGKNPRGGKPAESNEEAEREFMMEQRRAAGQNSKAGELPPAGSDSEDEGVAPKKPAGQSSTAGMLPPNSSDEEGGGDSSSSDEDDGLNEYMRAAPKKKEPVVVPKTPAEIAAEMERLSLIRKKREDDRINRIATEGWDRYAPVTSTNHPPGQAPREKC
ncbi:hypothetical protein FOA52_013284 [Chlamydomonas sp. UWO 241]|nr:hypothetical protein FOA52_013284 [Chlamydomonas sp. UWO 241]